MIICEIEQGNEQWQAERLGIPTASNFDRIITTKGEPSKQRQKYLYQLAAERITGIQENGYQNSNMERGQQLEDQARAFYELITGSEVRQVGFCYPDDKKLYGCSPDGLIGEDGLIEIKCPTSPVHVGYLLTNELPPDYIQQVQGQLFITGRKWCDFVSFYPGLKDLCIRVKPDKDFHNALKAELIKFCSELDEVVKKIGGKK